MPSIARFAALVSAALLLGAGPADDGRWLAGGYSFSDELGGFRILAVRGSGTRADPVVLIQELYSASAVVVVIRQDGPGAPQAESRRPGMALYLRIETVNASGLAWVEFSYELQVHLGKPSVYGDGLSFDQAQAEAGTVSADAFASYSRDFEPHDRLLFRDGKVDPKETATFSMLITDLTPTYQFHLVQDPRIPFS
ncbi:hypothetical protein [Chelativorans sp. AA-79]|uniref:hypothetical protein n=1 Tax=Chelativorans sp. AA-79 TaxID=3028735 RepID=UPI0023F73F6B|nr:hypothetical protein [Chelativorans sp. AA-79]WEX07710.1 hypothetical protein PVE73_16555 [Chelativorans sp. AA-79]